MLIALQMIVLLIKNICMDNVSLIDSYNCMTFTARSLCF